MTYDIFISYAHEDRESLVFPLVQKLRQKGYRVWFDEFCLAVGDNMIDSISRGMKDSRYAILILSKHFFNKGWTRFEFDGLVNINIDNPGKLLPIWYNVSKSDIQNFCPTLSNIQAIIYDKQSIRELVRALELKIGEYIFHVDGRGNIIRSRNKKNVPRINRECGYQTIQSINTDELIDENTCICTQETIIYSYSDEIIECKFNHWQHLSGEINVISHLAYNCQNGELISTDNEIIKNNGTNLISILKFKPVKNTIIRTVCEISTTNLYANLFVNGYSDIGFNHKKHIDLFTYYMVLPDTQKYQGIQTIVDDKEYEFSNVSGKLEMKYTKRNVKPLMGTKFVFKNLNLL